MTLRRAVCIAAGMIAVAAAAPAAAQFQQSAQPVPQQTSVWGDGAPQQQPNQPDPAWGPPPAGSGPSASPWNQPPAAAAPATSPWNQQQEPPCVAELMKLRDVADKRASAIRAANKRKASPKEACGLFGALVTAQAKMLKYATDNQKSCGIPPQFVTQIKQSQTQVSEIRTKVCNVAAAPQQRGPTLSDALTGPIPDSSNIKTGRGTFDTLTGSALGSR